MRQEDIDFLNAPRDIELIVIDSTLSLSVVESFASEYVVRAAGEVRIVCRWGGPAAGGPEWGGPEIAVAIIMGEALRRAASDAYSLLRGFMVDAYRKVKTRTGARIYVEGALAIGIDSESMPIRVFFCLPEGLSVSQLNNRLDMIERDATDVLRGFEQVVATAAIEANGRIEIKVCWDEQTAAWHECHPKLEESVN